MALSVKSGSFEFPTSTGNHSVTGVGFQPKFVLFWGTSIGASFGNNGGAVLFVGAAASSSERWACGVNDGDAYATSNSYRFSENDECIQVRQASGAIAEEADFVSMDADGFTINVTDAANAAVEKVSYLALGGDDLGNVKVGNASLGNSTGNLAITGVGFQPKACLFACVGLSIASAAHAILSVGAATDSSNEWLAAVASNHNVAVSRTMRYQRTDRCVAQIISDTVSWDCDFVSMDADGFTVNRNTAPGNDNVYYVALGGANLNVKVGSFNETSSSGTNVSQSVTGVGFQPDALLLTGWERAANSSLQAQMAFSFGAATGASEESVAHVSSEDAQGTMDTYRSHQNTKTYEARAVTDGAVVSDAELTTLDSDGFTLNWLNTDGGQDEVLYVALAGAAAAGFARPKVGGSLAAGRTGLVGD